MISAAKCLISKVFPPQQPPSGELWGYWVAHAETLRWILIILVMCIIFLSIVSLRAMRKAPIVIRVDEVGHAEIIPDLTVNNVPSDVEIMAFAKDFLRSYIELNSLTVQKDLTRALNMMTKKYQSAHLRELKDAKFLPKIIQANIQTQMEIKDLAMTTRSPTKIYLDVRGITSTTPLEDPNAPASKHGFIAKLTLAFVPRTERTPNGLLVDDYRQQIVPLEELLGSQKVLPKGAPGQEAQE